MDFLSKIKRQLDAERLQDRLERVETSRIGTTYPTDTPERYRRINPVEFFDGE